MNFKKRLLNLLQIRENEWWLVRQLFFQQFFSGAGIALFFTAAFSLFLQKFSINELPKVLIASAFMQWLTGYVYSKVEHLLSIKSMILIINIFIGASIILFRIAYGYTESIYFFFSMLVWYNVLYLLSSLDFWGLAALLFDVRQSKRLFGIISAGDIPAKFIGYTSAYIIAPIIGTINLLIAGGIAVLYSLVYWHRLKKSGHLDLHLHHHSHADSNSQKNENFGDAVIRFFDNKLVLNLALLSFLICSISTLVYFIFYAKIKSATHDDLELAGFISLFLASSRGVAIIMKLFFTNRITDKLGIRGSLLIAPVILLILLLPVFFMPMLTEGAKGVLIIFGLISVTNDVLRSAILTPVFLSVMQPLHAQVRLRAHNIVKGVMEPFGLLFIGLLLYLMILKEGEIDLFLLSYILIGLLLACIVWIFIVNSEYSKMLVVALRNRYFNGNDISHNNKESLAFFIKKSVSGDPSDVIFVLSLISKSHSPETSKIIENAMHHKDDKVRIEAIKTIERMHLINNMTQMKTMADQTSNPELLYEAVKAIYTLNEDADYNDYLMEGDIKLMSAAIIGMLRNEKFNEKGLKYLREWTTSANSELRIYACEVISESARHIMVDEIIKLLGDENEDVRNAAIKASCKMHGHEIVDALLKNFVNDADEKLILKALIANSQHGMPAIQSYIKTNALSFEKKIKLITVFGKGGGVAAKKSLDELLDTEPECQNVIIANLSECNFKVDKSKENKYRQLLNRLLDEAALLVLHVELLSETKKFPMLAHALLLELDVYREVILNVFTFFYQTEKIQHARAVFFLNKVENIANALEIIDVTVQKESAQKFIALYDIINLDQKVITIRKQFSVRALSIENLINDILNARSAYNNWTKSCAIYELDKTLVESKKTLIRGLTKSDNYLIKETATYMLEKQD